jgi:hypothetical protein
VDSESQREEQEFLEEVGGEGEALGHETRMIVVVTKMGRCVNYPKLLKIYDSETKTPEKCSEFTNFLVRFLHKKLEIEFQRFIDGRMHWRNAKFLERSTDARPVESLTLMAQ